MSSPGHNGDADENDVDDSKNLPAWLESTSQQGVSLPPQPLAGERRPLRNEPDALELDWQALGDQRSQDRSRARYSTWCL